MRVELKGMRKGGCMCRGECGVGPFVIGVGPERKRDAGWGCLMPDWDAKIGVVYDEKFLE
jgi:hypothetical protein